MRVRFLALFTVLLLGAAIAATPQPPGRQSIRDANSYSTVFLNAEGVDTCSYYSAAHWNQYFLKPNMWGLGFYLGGATADYVSCFEPSATWLGNLNSGWKVMPIWDGLQAPCSGNSKLMSTDTSTAASQGASAANNAIARSNTIGLGAPNIIYLDMEAYSSSCSACR